MESLVSNTAGGGRLERASVLRCAHPRSCLSSVLACALLQTDLVRVNYTITRLLAYKHRRMG